MLNMDCQTIAIIMAVVSFFAGCIVTALVIRRDKKMDNVEFTVKARRHQPNEKDGNNDR